jgi:4-hydroxy-tetrahydrodipicolinate synthase
MYRQINGCLVTVPVFFLENGELDLDRVYRHVRHLARDGAGALKIAGLTGECASLSIEEHIKVLEVCFAAVAEVFGGGDFDFPILASVNHNEIKTAQTLARAAYEIGYRWLDSTLPYFSQTTLEGVRRHFGALREAAPEATIIMHHAPKRTGGRQLSSSEIIKLHQSEVIDGLIWSYEVYVDSVWQLNKLSQYSRDNGHRLVLIGGDDYHIGGYYGAGCTACQSVLANVMITDIDDINQDLRYGHINRALNRLHSIFPLVEAMKEIEERDYPNPVPIKMLMSLVWPDKYEATFRNSLTLPPADECQAFVEAAEARGIVFKEVSRSFQDFA